MGRRDSTNIAQAIVLFDRALAMDSTDARVWSALAEAQSRLANTATGDVGKLASEAEQSARRAIALNDNLAEAHGILGNILDTFAWRWDEAEQEFKKALALAPGDADIMRRKALLAETYGKQDEALALYTRAVGLDPINARVHHSQSYTYLYLRRFPEAVAAARRAIALDPESPATHVVIAEAYLFMGKIDSAMAAADAEPWEVDRLFAVALVYDAAGKKQQAEAACASLLRKYHETAAFQIAELYGYRGKVDKAFEWLEKAYAVRDPGICQLQGDPLLEKIEKDPRYKIFLKKTGLPH